MFQIGFWEIVVVIVVALWVLGPKRLPAVARVCGRSLSRAKQSYLNLKNEISEEIRMSESKPTDSDDKTH
jgi:sec-independent protein translocase protein TatB